MTTMRFLKVDCDQAECPQYGTCSQIPTEYHTPHQDDRIDILFIGEGAGKREAKYSRPFIGAAGSLLKQTMEMFDTDLTVAFSNIIRANPLKTVRKSDGTIEYEDRPPTQRETEFCLPYLLRDIKRLRPKKIVCLGKIAWVSLMGIYERMSETRGKWSEYAIGKGTGSRIPIMHTYHPARVLRDEGLITLFMQDLEKVFGIRDGLTIDNTGETVIVDTLESVTEMVDELLATTDMVAVDTEAKNLVVSKKHLNKAICIQFCADGHKAFVLPLRHRQTPWTKENFPKVINELRRLFNSTPKFKNWCGWGIKYDLALMRTQHGIWMNRNRPMLDGMAMWFLLDENRSSISKGELGGEGTYTLKQAGRYFDFDGYEAEVLRARSEGALWKLPIQELADYGAMDVRVTWQAVKNFYKLANRREPGYAKRMYIHARRYFSDAYRFLAMAEINGMMIDQAQVAFLTGKDSPLLRRRHFIEKKFQQNSHAKDALALLAKRKTTSRDEDGQAVHMTTLFSVEAAANQTFDVGKGEARLLMFFEVMKLKWLKRGKPTALFPRGQPSIDKNFVGKYEEDIPEVAMLAEHRKMNFMMNTFLYKIGEMVTPGSAYFDPDHKLYRPEGEDGRIRPSIGLTFTQTGRSNQWNPSLQQIPSAEEDDTPGKFLVKKAVKDVFIASPGNIIVQIDYRVSEVRWLGLLSRCAGLMNIFLTAKKYTDEYRKTPTPENKIKAKYWGDVHQQNAALAYKKPIEDVTKAERQNIKSALVFGGIYGAGLKSIAARIKRDIDYTRDLMRKFWERMPGAKACLDKYVQDVENGYCVENNFFQKRRLYAWMVGKINSNSANDKVKDRGRQILSHCKNQAKNSPIQNASSVNSLIAAAILADHIIDHDLEDEWLLTNCVHDSVVSEIPFRWSELNTFLVVAEDVFTTKVSEYIEKHYGFEMKLPLEVDFEIGFSWGSLHKWDYTKDHLIEIFRKLKKEYDALSETRKVA